MVYSHNGSDNDNDNCNGRDLLRRVGTIVIIEVKVESLSTQSSECSSLILLSLYDVLENNFFKSVI